jgi:hypothetical protein
VTRRLLALALLASLAACTSPEATRQRAGGPGADVGNVGERVELHAGSAPYYRTPNVLPDARGERSIAASPPTR